MPRVVFREQATENLADIFGYILEGTGSPRLAAEQIARLESQCRALSHFPHRGLERNDIYPGLRLLPVERRSVIAYVIERVLVRIINIFHAGQDFETLLRAN